MHREKFSSLVIELHQEQLISREISWQKGKCGQVFITVMEEWCNSRFNFSGTWNVFQSLC